MIPVPKGQWAKISTNTLADVLFKVGGKYLTVVKGGGDPVTGQFAWSGASFDTDRGRVVMDANGGHGDGADNGVYDFDAGAGLFSMVAVPTVELIPSTSQPSIPVYTGAGGIKYKAARHNYGAQVYMATVKRSWQGSGVAWWSGGGAGRMSWETDVATGISFPADEFGIGSGLTGDNTSPDIQSAWDSNNKRVLYCDHGRLRAYDPAKPAGSRVSGVDAGEGDGLSDGRHRGMSALYDPKRDRFVMFGAFAEGVTCLVWEPGGGKYKRRPQGLGPIFSGQWTLGVAPLVAYDPAGDRYAVTGGGTEILVIHPDTWAVLSLRPTTGENPGPAHSTGTYNRGGYWPAQDVLVVVHSVTGGAYAYRPDRGTTVPVVVPPVVVEPPPAPTPSPVTLPERVFKMLAAPDPAHGPGEGMGHKHMNVAVCPVDGRVYLTGGDHNMDSANGTRGGGSYRQITLSLDVAERLASTDKNAGWRIVHPEFGHPGGIQPKMTDYLGWTWDSTRNQFWCVPGIAEISSFFAPDETAVKQDDARFKWRHLMAFRPFEPDPAKRWIDYGGSLANIGFRAWDEDTWFATYDAPADRLVRIGYHDKALVDFYDCKTGLWSTKYPADQGIRLMKEYIAHDPVRRCLYGIDAIHGKLYRYDLGPDAMIDLGPVPGGPDGRENITHVVWDAANSVLLWRRIGGPGFYAYHPDTATWETIPIVTDPPGMAVAIRAAVYVPAVNASLWFGGKPEDEPGAGPYLYLFRYGKGSPVVEPPVVTPPVVIPPVVVPPVPTRPRLRMTVEVPAGYDLEVNGRLVL